MEDIVDRLRVLNFMGPWKEAADEIERLRNSIQEVKELLINLSNYTNPRTLAYGIGRAVVRLEDALEKE